MAHQCLTFEFWDGCIVALPWLCCTRIGIDQSTRERGASGCFPRHPGKPFALHALTAAGVTGVAISLISLLSFVTFCSLSFSFF
jgi:hypothetical protein